MSSDKILEKVKKLRKITGVGFKDCKNAIDENKGDIEKSIDYLRKKGIAKANKKMERVAADGLICLSEKNNKFSMIEINSETDFVAKNNDFIKFAEEISSLSLVNFGKMEDILNSKMQNSKNVKDNLKNMTWSFAKIIERASYGTTLFPGDVIGSGTCGTGCFLELNGSTDKKQWLQDGDVVEIDAGILGRLSNKIKLVQ